MSFPVMPITTRLPLRKSCKDRQGVSSYLCYCEEICDVEDFIRRYTIYIHQLLDLRLRHSIGRRAQHVCACGKTFKKQFQLANHQRCLLQNFSILTAFNSRVHSGDRPFVCHTCGKAFNQEVTLRTHMRIHSGARPYKCDLCGEAFNATSALVAHRQWKHTDGSRPFLCSFCSKSFPTKAAVKKHETIHKPVTEKRHPCTECDKRFARADHLKSHMRAHKPNVPVLVV